MKRFELVSNHGDVISNFATSEEAHARLGMIAERFKANIHIHEGMWSDSSYSVAYAGNDPILGAIAVVRITR